MENLVEKLQGIAGEFNSIENPTQEQINDLKQKEFDLFGEIGTIRELCEYYKTDMTMDGISKDFISGMYSGVVNGSMFVVNEILKIIEEEEKDLVSLTDKLLDKLRIIQGISND